ncbi:MAG: hypothetical protein JNM62_12565 [Flavobacteriales bacterium]|nr:hypothetical protein [Flavobacteriales bacterium]
MKRGILFAALVALIGSASVSCRRATDPQRIAAVDSLITAMEAARLTLNELDTQRYATADSILKLRRVLFLRRFNDTLDKPSAALLGDQFVQLREATRRATDHRHVMDAVTSGSARLKQLKQDLSASALLEEEVGKAILNETNAAEAIENSVMHVITNYQANQRVLDLQARVDSLLDDTLPSRRTP